MKTLIVILLIITIIPIAVIFILSVPFALLGFIGARIMQFASRWLEMIALEVSKATKGM